MSAKVRVGIVGAGWWCARVHLPSIVSNPDADLVAICDADINRALEAQNLFGADYAVDEMEEMLTFDLDCILISTPHNHHFKPAALALKHGIDVMIEKPMTLVPSEAWELVKLSYENSCNLHLGYTFPHSKHVQQVQEMVSKGELGELEFGTALFTGNIAPLYEGHVNAQVDPSSPFPSQATTYTSKKHGGGQLYTQTTHPVSTMLFLSKSIPASVTGVMNGTTTKVDLSNSLIMQTRDNFFATIGSSGAMTDHAERFEEYRLIGKNGHVILDTKAGTLQSQLRGHSLVTESKLSDSAANPIEGPVNTLISTVLNKPSVRANGILGALTVDVLEACRLSSIEKRTISFQPPLDLDGNFDPTLIKERSENVQP